MYFRVCWGLALSSIFERYLMVFEWGHKTQRQHLSAVKNRKLCGAALAQKGELCGRVRRKLSNYAAKLRRNFHKSAVIVRHLKLIFWVLLASAL